MNTDPRDANRNAIRAQALDLLGREYQIRIARALGKHASAVSRWFNPPEGRDDVPPIYLVVILELLQELPPDQWPPRWQA